MEKIINWISQSFNIICILGLAVVIYKSYYPEKDISLEEYNKTIKTLQASKHIIEEKDRTIVNLLQERRKTDSVISYNNSVILSLAEELEKRQAKTIEIANDTIISEVEVKDILSKLKRYER